MISNKDHGTDGAHRRPTANAEIGPSPLLAASYRSLYACNRCVSHTRAHAYSRDVEECHTLVCRIYTRTRRRSSRCRALHHHAVKRGREKERERESKEIKRKGGRERERMRDTIAREKARRTGNTGRCTWKLCGAVKPRRLLFTICREHTKFIRRDHTTSIDMREADRFSECALFRARTTTLHQTIFRRRVVLIVRGIIAVARRREAAIGLNLTITRRVENFVTIDGKINHPTAAANIQDCTW